MSTSRRMLLINNDDDNMKNIIIDLTKFTRSDYDSNYNYYNSTAALNGFKSCGIFTSNSQITEWINEYINETGLLNYKVFVVKREGPIHSPTNPPSKTGKMNQMIGVNYKTNTDGSTSTESDFDITYTSWVSMYFHGTASYDWGWITFYINGSNFVGMRVRGI